MNNKSFLRPIYFSFLLFAFGCSKKVGETKLSSHPYQTTIFIAMPQSVTVSENLAPILYDGLYRHFARVGFQLAPDSDSAYSLNSKLLSLENISRYVSQDLLPYAFKIRLEVECKLYSPKKELLAAKVFNFYKTALRPDNPALNSTFLTEQYKELVEQVASKIDRYFRRFYAIS